MIIPAIVTERLFEAIERPNIMRWHSLSSLCEGLIKNPYPVDRVPMTVRRLNDISRFAQKQALLIQNTGCIPPETLG